MTTSIRWLPPAKIVTEGLQCRAEIDRDAVAEYADAMQAGAKFPPLIVFNADDQYFLADGFHRLEAQKHIRQAKVACDVRPGGFVDALKFALGANTTHGLRRTRDDVQKAVRMAYVHRKELKLPDVPAANLIAGLIGCNHETVKVQLAKFASWKDATARTGKAADRRADGLEAARLTASA